MSAAPALTTSPMLWALTATKWVLSLSLPGWSAAEHAFIALLARNGLRVSEAIGADIGALGLERGHRTLTVLRKGGKVVTVLLAPRTARAVDLAIRERLSGPIFVGPDGRRFDRHVAGRVVRRIGTTGPGSTSRSGLIPCVMPSSPQLGRERATTRRPRGRVPRRPRDDDAL
jgi:hypothetical protein